MIYAFKANSLEILKELKRGAVDDLFQCKELIIVGGYVGVKNFDDCKKDKSCLKWAKEVECDVLAYKEDGKWKATSKQSASRWKPLEDAGKT